MADQEWLKEVREIVNHPGAQMASSPRERMDGERLRKCVAEIDRLTEDCTLYREARAAQVETISGLTAEVSRLRGALNKIVAADEAVNHYGIGHGACIARMALSPGESGAKEE